MKEVLSLLLKEIQAVRRLNAQSLSLQVKSLALSRCALTLIAEKREASGSDAAQVAAEISEQIEKNVAEVSTELEAWLRDSGALAEPPATDVSYWDRVPPTA